MKSITIKLEKYFEAFSQKDIKSLQNMFSHDISIHDWTGGSNGLSESIKFVNNIFNNVNTIHLDLIESCICGNVAYCEILIIIDGVSIHVLDVISFNDERKIANIVAYKK
jgi:hypothetical protein